MDGLIYKKVSDNSISNLPNLCSALSISLDDLREVLALPDDKRYEETEARKSDGTKRIAFKPHYLVRRIQRRINHRLFIPQKKLPNTVIWPKYIFGSIPNQYVDGIEVEKDYIACARMHCNAKSILKIDIKNFFDNVHSDLVLEIFRDFFKFDEEVSETLTNICCYNGRIPQGGLTSSYLASLALHDIEPKVVR